jgi:hypothetical protein
MYDLINSGTFLYISSNKPAKALPGCHHLLYLVSSLHVRHRLAMSTTALTLSHRSCAGGRGRPLVPATSPSTQPCVGRHHHHLEHRLPPLPPHCLVLATGEALAACPPHWSYCHRSAAGPSRSASWQLAVPPLAAPAPVLARGPCAPGRVHSSRMVWAAMQPRPNVCVSRSTPVQARCRQGFGPVAI